MAGRYSLWLCDDPDGGGHARLLIRGFGVGVSGGAPVMIWGFINPGSSFYAPVYPGFLAVLAPCLLGGRMLAGLNARRLI